MAHDHYNGYLYIYIYMGLSENGGKPLNPMVLLIIITFLNGYFIGNIPNIFRQTHIYNWVYSLLCS